MQFFASGNYLYLVKTFQSIYMLRLKNLGVLLSILIVISCTIVKDSDITSLDEFKKLTLKSFEIDQALATGSSSIVATWKYDSTLNIVSKISGYHITLLRGFSLPALGTKKVQFRSGVNTKTELKIYYRDDGLPITFFVLAGDSLVEFYRFYYNAAKQLAKVTTDIDPIDNKPQTLHFKDSIYYPSASTTTVSAYPSSITRNSPLDPSQAGTFTFSGCNQCSTSAMTQFNSSQGYMYNFYSGDCHNGNSSVYPYVCGGVYKNSTNGGGNNGEPQVKFQSSVTFNRTLKTVFTSAKTTDIIYFHPLMLLGDKINQGGLFFWFYSIDWFRNDGTSFANSDQITITYNYGH